MEKTLVATIPFSVVDTKRSNYFGKIGTASFGRTLIENMKNSKINIESPRNGDAIIPVVTENNGFLYTVLVEGNLHKKKLEIILSGDGKEVMFEVNFFNISDGKWKPVISNSRFISMNEFNEQFLEIMESLS